MASTRHFNDVTVQDFSFKSPIMAYIFDNISYKHLFKLYQCCKLFPNKFPLTAIHQILDVTKFFHYTYSTIPNENISKIWLFDSLRFHPNLRSWISKIFICTIKEFRAIENISENEFKILASSKSIEDLTIENVINENGTFLFVEDILAYVPKASAILLANSHITPKTFTTLAKMERNCKICRFRLGFVNFEINPDELLKFIVAHASNDCSEFGIFFEFEIPKDYVQNLQTYVKSKIYFEKGYKKFMEKPCFHSAFGSVHH